MDIHFRTIYKYADRINRLNHILAELQHMAEEGEIDNQTFVISSLGIIGEIREYTEMICATAASCGGN